MNNKVAILLGSKTDLPLIEPSMQYYEHFGINAEIHVMSAHRNPKDNCLSLFKNSFASAMMNWSNNSRDIANYYNIYEELLFGEH